MENDSEDFIAKNTDAVPSKNSDKLLETPPIFKGNKKLSIINFALIITIFVGLLIYMIVVDGIDNILTLLGSVNYVWVICGLFCLLGVWFCDSLTLHVPLKRLYPQQKFSNSIKVTMIGQLFNNITPFSSGGQPMQAYELSKTGKRVSDSLSVLAMKFILTQLALICFTLLVVVVKFDFFMNFFKDYLWIVCVGFSLNIIAIIVVLLMGVKPKLILSVCSPFVHLFSKIHFRKFYLIKDYENTMQKLQESCKNFSEQFKAMKAHKKIVSQVFIIAFLQSLFYYAITYMVYRAFGNAGTGFFEIITVQAFLLLIMTFIPTPGSGLGAEGGFLLLFHSIFTNGTIHMSILFWRMYTFYLPIIIGTLFLLPTKQKK